VQETPDLASLEILRRVRESGYEGGKTALVESDFLWQHSPPRSCHPQTDVSPVFEQIVRQCVEVWKALLGGTAEICGSMWGKLPLGGFPGQPLTPSLRLSGRNHL
jgi:hypothetical protein